MPTAEGYYTTYDLSKVNREDLLDIITMISPVETPFFSSVKKGSASNTLHEWGTDELAAANSANAHIEGQDASGWAAVDRERLNNRTQIFTNPFAVTTTQEKVDTAGIKSEKAWQAAKKMKEHKRDIEASTLRDAVGAVAGGATSAARQQAPIKAFISGDATQGAPTTPDNRIPPAAGANQKITEDDINTALETVWTEGGMPDTLLCSARIKRRISNFSLVGLGTDGTTGSPHQANPDIRRMGMDDRKLARRIDVYEGDFGMLRIIPDRYIPTNTGSGSSTDVYILEMARWTFDFLISPFIEDLAKLGDSFRSWVYSQGCCTGRAPKGNLVYETVLNSI